MTSLQKIAPTPARPIMVRNPFNGQIVGEIAEHSGAEVAATVLRAKTAQREFRYSTPAVRRALLNALAAEIAKDAENLARIISSEMGKTIREARNEVRRAQNTLKLSGDAATFLDGEALHCAIVEGGVDRLATITYEPVGVIGAITPFNYPLNLCATSSGRPLPPATRSSPNLRQRLRWPLPASSNSRKRQTGHATFSRSSMAARTAPCR